MKRDEAFRIVAMLQGAWPHRQLPDSTAEVYAMTLSDLAYAEVRDAVTRLIQTSKFLPSVAEIREVVVEERCDLPAAEVAWGEVRAAIHRVGIYFVPVFECDEIEQATNIIGWETLCNSTNIASERARWIDTYRALRGRRIELEATGRYIPSERQLPAEGEGGPGHGHGSRVLVRTSSTRPALPAGPAPRRLKAVDP